MMHDALERLAELADGEGPPFARPIELSADLLACVRELRWLGESAPPVARLSAVFRRARCDGFDLWVDGGRARYLLWCARRTAEPWEEGPRLRDESHLSSRERAVLRKHPPLREKHLAEVALQRRIIELVPGRIADFVAHLEEQAVHAARLSCSCARCGRPLTDEASRERGIGPECLKKGAR